MSKKRNIETERMLRRIDAKKKRLDRVMSGYLYNMHPEIYAEGLRFYNALDRIYPNKKDLRKTPQFLGLQHGKPPGTTTKVQRVSEKIVKDTFVLEIPLEKRKTAVRQSSSITRATETITTSAPKETADISMTTNTTEKPADTIVPAETTPTNASGTTDLLPLDDATLDQIIQELNSDTNLHEFFNDIDFGMYEQDILLS